MQRVRKPTAPNLSYEPDEIDPTRMAAEENDEEDEGWEEVGSDGEPVSKEEDEPVDYTILSKNLV